MEKRFDLISIGDTTLDVFLEIEDAHIVCKLQGKNCKLCVNYADKIPVKRLTSVPGVGNSANLAVGSARLGLKVALYTNLGNDDVGKEIFKRLKKERIAADYIKFDKKRGTNYSAVLNYKGERTILVYHEPRDYDLPKMKKSRWVYFSSLAAGHGKLHKQVVNYVVKNKAKLGFNPGTFQLNEGLKVIRRIMKVCTVFIVNKEEAQRLLGDHEDMKTILKMLKKEGPEIVVITDGPNGSYAYDGKEFYFQEILKSPIVERTGTGDAYSTGFIAALAYGKDIREAMKWGTINSASVLQKIGAQEGLLNKRQLLKALKGNPKLKTKNI